MKPDQERLKNVLIESVLMLCQRGLNFNSELKIKGVIGITVDCDDNFYIHIDQTIDTGNFCDIDSSTQPSSLTNIKLEPNDLQSNSTALNHNHPNYPTVKIEMCESNLDENNQNFDSSLSENNIENNDNNHIFTTDFNDSFFTQGKNYLLNNNNNNNNNSNNINNNVDNNHRMAVVPLSNSYPQHFQQHSQQNFSQPQAFPTQAKTVKHKKTSVQPQQQQMQETLYYNQQPFQNNNLRPSVNNRLQGGSATMPIRSRGMVRNISSVGRMQVPGLVGRGGGLMAPLKKSNKGSGGVPYSGFSGQISRPKSDKSFKLVSRYLCDIGDCNASFTLKSNLRRHQRSKHGGFLGDDGFDGIEGGGGQQDDGDFY